MHDLISVHVITWYRCGQSTFSSCDHVGGQRKATMDKSTIGQRPQRMVLLSILAFFCLPTWLHDENVDCPHLYHVITWTEMGSYTLIVIILKYFLFWGFCPLWFLSFQAFVRRCFCPFWLFFVHPRDRMTRMLIVHTCIMWSHEQKWDCTP